MVERQRNQMDFLTKLEFLLFQILKKETKIDRKPRSVRKSNNLRTLRRELVRILLFILMKCLNLLIFEGLKLIKLLHFVDFSCWAKILIFGLFLGILELKNLRGRDSPLQSCGL